MALALDHLVIAATDLDSGEAWLRDQFGVPLAGGGQHTGMGTHNRLLQLGHGVYLELIAADPSQPEPAQKRPFMLDDPGLKARLARSPLLVHWVLRSTELDADLSRLTYQPGPATPMVRGALRWRLTVASGGRPAADGLLPSVIQWDVPDDQHPTARLPDTGVQLDGLTVHAPRAVLDCLPRFSAPVDILIEASNHARLSARFLTPRGPVVIDQSPFA